MTLRRVHLPPDRIAGDRAELSDEARHYLRDVLRLAPGAVVEVFDGAGRAFDGRIEDGFLALALGTARSARPAGAALLLLVALAKGEKMDLVVQKATELGAARIAPFAAERSVVRLEPERGEERARRWRRIAEEAARQCGRSDVPEVRAPATLEGALAALPEGARAVILEPGGAPLSSVPAGAPAYAAIVGPEGGLTPAEVERCRRAGAQPVSVGPRVLRAETAAIVAVAYLQLCFGDVG